MHIPGDLSDLLHAVAADFPAILAGNLVGIYLWGSLTYNAFNEACSDVDFVVVTRHRVNDDEFSKLDDWFKAKKEENRWVERIDMRVVIDGEFLDKTSQCCGFYHYLERLVRHESDGNPIIWLNIGQCGITLWGVDAKRIAPPVSNQCLNDALMLELAYLRKDLASNVGDRSPKAFVHNAYAILTACRILYSAHHRSLVSKQQACDWALETIPRRWHAVVQQASENRLKNGGSTTQQLEEDAKGFVEYVTAEVKRMLISE